MKKLLCVIIMALLVISFVYGCGKKGPPTLKEIKAGKVHETAH